MAAPRDLIKGPHGTVWVEGIREVTKKMEAAAVDLDQMSDLMHSLGNIVIAHTNVPRISGELSVTLRSGRGKTKAVVRAGYNTRRAGYAAVVHYGNPKRGSRANPFLEHGLKRSRQQVIAALANGIDDIIRSNDLR